MLHPRQPAGRRLSIMSAEWLAVCAEGDIINGPVREKEEKELCLCVMGMVVSPGLRKAPKRARTASATLFKQSDDSLNAGVRAGEDAPGVKSEASCRLHTVCHYCAIHAVQLAPGTAQLEWAACPLIRGSSSLIRRGRRMQSFDTDWQTHPRG